MSDGDRTPPQFRLDEYEAFRAMSAFLDQFAERAGDDLPTLLADITVLDDGGTSDHAAWEDWIGCARAVKGAARDAPGGSG